MRPAGSSLPVRAQLRIATPEAAAVGRACGRAWALTRVLSWREAMARYSQSSGQLRVSTLTKAMGTTLRRPPPLCVAHPHLQL